MPETHPIVFVVDNDSSVRDALNRLIRSVGLDVELFGSAQEFLRWRRSRAPACIVMDVRLPGTSGLDFQRQLKAANIRVPVIFITAHGDIPMSVRAMRAGAIDFLTKPFRDQDLLDSIHVGLERDRERLDRGAQIAVLRERLDFLTPRELVSGMPNKLMPPTLEFTENTVKVHRSRAMEKMQAQSLAELVRMMDRLMLAIEKPS